MRRLRIAITANGQVGDLAACLWSSGVNQNIVYLAMLLQRLPNVEEVAILGVPAGGASNPLADYLGLPTLQESEIDGRLDVIIELGVRADQERMAAFRRGGGRLVSYMAGNALVMNFEALACGLDHGEVLSAAGFDACWITPQHWRTNRGYSLMTRSTNTVVAPHLWHPRCFLDATSAARNNPFFRTPPDEGAWRVGVFDPNVNVVKTFHLPFLACEQAHRRSPDSIGRVSLFSAQHLAGVPHVEEFIAASTLAQAKKVFVEERRIVAEMLGRHIDAVVTHQWENDLNYLYWDVLYANRPLIHNAEPIRHLGYYFPAFDPAAGGEALLRACRTHHERPAAARAEELAFLRGLSPDDPAVQTAYAALLDDLYG